MERSFAVPPEALELDADPRSIHPTSKSIDCAHWRLLVSDFRVEELAENEFAFFNVEYSDSTLLNAVDVALLDELRKHTSESISTQALQKSVAAVFGVEVDQVLKSYCQRSLIEMETIGLIFRADA